MPFFRFGNPLIPPAYSSMKRGLENNILRIDRRKQFPLSFRSIATNQLFVQSYRQRRVGSKARHFFPLSCTYRLLNRVQIQLGQTFQFLHHINRRESAVGIHTQLYFLRRKMRTYMAKQSQLFIKVDSAYFQFDATKTGCHFFFYPGKHPVKVSHPDKPVYRNPCSARKSRIIERPASNPEMPYSRLQPKQNGRVIA